LIIHLLRHAKTEKLASSGMDFDRTLAQKGLRQCALLKSHLSQLKFKNTSFLCSSALRTKQTALNVFDDIQSFQFSDSLYLASDREIMNEIIKVEKNRNVLLIGHNDGISDFASYLVGDMIHLKTGEYLRLHVPEIEDYSLLTRGCAVLAAQFRPEVI
jgi:phosphohistidine phosphatase